MIPGSAAVRAEIGPVRQIAPVPHRTFALSCRVEAAVRIRDRRRVPEVAAQAVVMHVQDAGPTDASEGNDILVVGPARPVFGQDAAIQAFRRGGASTPSDTTSTVQPLGRADGSL